MLKLLRRTLTPVLLLSAVLALSPLAWAAPAADTAAQYTTSITGGKVVITNNYGIADVVEITLDNAPTGANAVYWVFLPGVADKSAQLGAVTIKKGATTGKLLVAAGKLSDLNPAGGSINITTGGGAMIPCNYGPAAVTTPPADGKVKLRNTPNSVELLIVDKSIVTKGMTAYAIVNGKVYKATAKADAVDLQVSLAKNMEIGSTVWYTVAAAGCQDAGYKPLSLGEVELTGPTSDSNIKVFFQGNSAKTSSIMVLGLNIGDTVKCYDAADKLLKTVRVSGGTVAALTGLPLSVGNNVYITVTANGKTESGKTEVIVPALLASPALSANAVKVVNTLADDATVTVNGLTAGDTVKIYDADGYLLAEDDAIAANQPGEEPDENPEQGGAETAAPAKVDLVFEALDLGDKATTIYVSVTIPDRGESAWLKVVVPAAQ